MAPIVALTHLVCRCKLRALNTYAQVVKLVDTPASGAGGRKAVEVQVLSWAPVLISPYPLNALKIILPLMQNFSCAKTKKDENSNRSLFEQKL